MHLPFHFIFYKSYGTFYASAMVGHGAVLAVLLLTSDSTYMIS